MISKRQKEVFDFVKVFIKKNKYSPSLEEIKNYFGLASVSTAHHHISKLRALGYLPNESNRPRAFVPYTEKDTIEVPLVGTIAAGYPIEAIEYPNETITLEKEKFGGTGQCFALRVAGDSMVDEGIFDGDTVIIKKQSVAENGQTVVAIIDDNQATLKKIYREKSRFRLEPRNQTMLPFYRKEVEIRGVVVQIIQNIYSENYNNIRQSAGKYRTADLFAGIGGIRLGFEKAGFSTVFANDFEPNCKKTYDLNFKNSKLVVEDIRKVGIDDLPDFDFLLGGFPCQAFSIAGYRQGFNDKKDRGNLFFDVARILELRKPEGFLLENVKNLKNHDHGKTFRIIEESLKGLGYHLRVQVLNSMDYGNIPQNRERIYIVGFKNHNYADKFCFPKPIKLTKTIADILEAKVNEKYYYNGKPLYNRLKDYIKDEGKIYQWRRQYVRENKKGVCPTLTANMGMGGHNVPIIRDKKGIRKLTPMECARIQGFPENYKLPELADSVLYKQIGNSVSVPVVEHIAKQIKKAME